MTGADMTDAAFWRAVEGYIPEGTAPALWPDARADREKLGLRVFAPRDPDANPYYYSGRLLGQCVAAVRDIFRLAGPQPADPAAEGSLGRLLEAMGAPSGERDAAEALRECPHPYARDFGYLVSHHVISVARIAGGHRGQIENDTEIDLRVSLLPGCDTGSFLRVLDPVCKRHGVEWQRLEGR